jgi:arsenical pump membrane protein
LFVIAYAVGTLVTVFLSNDATAVVLTPAVLAAVRKARATALPYLLICAFIANAASFVLPISNPANLVVYGSKMPPLGAWLKSFALPSVVAIAVTFLVLRFAMGKHLRSSMEKEVERPKLSRAGKFAAGGIVGAGVVLMIASSFGIDLGLPTFLAALLVAIVVGSPFAVLRHISWSVLFLVAGLFVMVAAVDQAGVLTLSRHLLQQTGALTAAFGVALLANIVNNLPVGLIAGSAMQGAHVPQLIRNAVLIGIDLGPNLSITGSLATILWLMALRREGEDVGFFEFLRFGALVMTPALALSVLTLVLIN